MKIELCCCEDTILTEIAHKEFKQRDIAKTYWFCLQSKEKINWGKINRAIIDRWSVAGLDRIKKMAWSGKCFEELL